MSQLFYSVENLSPRILDDLNVWVLPFVSLFALINSIICLVILSHEKLKGLVYKHLVIDSAASALYSFSNCFIFLIRCGIYCDLGYNYWSKFYEIYVFIYFGKSIELFIMMIEINLAFFRFFSFTNLHKKHVPFNIKLILFLLISFSTCIPVCILPRTISQIGYLASNNTTLNETIIHYPLYIVAKSEIGKNATFGYIILFISILQGVGLLGLLVLINFLIVIRLKAFLAHKKESGCK
jgi:hypothetical protein